MSHNSAKDLELIQRALAGERGSDQRSIAATGVKIVATLLKKNKDYGSSAWQSPTLAPNLPPRTGILVRLSDKIQRLRQLMLSGKAEIEESIEETMLDFTGYSILWIAYPDETVRDFCDGQPDHDRPAAGGEPGSPEPDQAGSGAGPEGVSAYYAGVDWGAPGGG